MTTAGAGEAPPSGDWWQDIAGELAAGCDPAERTAAGQGFVVSRSQLRMLGVPDALVRRRVRTGRWTSVWRGWVSVLPSDSGTVRATRAAAVALSRPGSVVSHHAAARLLAIPLLHESARVRLTVASASGAGGWPGYVLHAAALPATERATWFGVPVTTPARTVVDIARLDGAAAGLVAADGALHLGHVRPASLTRACATARYRPGIRTADRVVALAHRAAESPLESLTRLVLADAGYEDVALQAPIVTSRGTFFVDLLLRAPRVIVEADGRLKYDRPESLWQEKLRQDALERSGYRVVRVTWDDITHRSVEVVRRVRDAAARPSSATF